MTDHTWPSSRTTQSRAGTRDRKDSGPASTVGASTCSLGLPTHLKGAPTSQQASFTGPHLDPHPPTPPPCLAFLHSAPARCHSAFPSPQLHPHDSLQRHKLQFLGNLELSLGLYGSQTCIWCSDLLRKRDPGLGTWAGIRRAGRD